MFESDKRPGDKRSLLALGVEDEQPRETVARRPGSLLSVPVDHRQDDTPPRRASPPRETRRASEPVFEEKEPRASLSERFASMFSRSEKQAEPTPESAYTQAAPREDEPPARHEQQDRRFAGDHRHTDRQQDAADDDDQRWKPLIDPMKIIGGVVKSRYLIIAMTLLGALLGVMIALSTPKKYEAAAELLVDPRDLKLTDRDLTQTGLSGEAALAVVENQVRVLTSGTVLNRVVDQLNLQDDPEFNGRAVPGGVGEILSMARAIFSRPDGASEADNRRALAVGNLAKSLTVERGGRTFVITVAAKTLEPEKSALIANTMTNVFLQTYGELQADTAGRAATELTSRLDELRAGVEQAERKVEAFKAENDIIDASGRLITDDEILKLNDQLSAARARTFELNAKASSAGQVNADAVLNGALPEQLSSSAMTELRSQYAMLKQESDRLAVRLGPRHPQRLAADSQLAGAREQINGELRRIMSSTQVELRRGVQLEQELASRLAQLKVRQGSLSDELVTLRELEREVNAKRAVYEGYLLRARETGEQKDLNLANMNVISKAFPPLTATGPSRGVISIAGMLLGLMAGVGIGALRGAYEGLRDNADRPKRKATSQPLGEGRRATDRPAPVSRRDPNYDERYAPPREPMPEQRYAAHYEEPQPSQSSIDEIREELREFRQAVHDLSERRARKRYF
ncbi:GumC family protein [Mesorhizobium sp. SB112]|uniref:GumC family protein n=1 Tax=Mesorhizobium sp. SB112 TaxID=3151853 RepID=UPI003265F9E8